ncbi:hypothetical protein [Pseudoxanthomonas sp.]|uniref:hypothetical protein n=1 Tax=Pseudoxanthomonas sp. TaxID=1871049 RepID=UPI00261B9444|nr:hypothetical protein [Pseudoxanthomonas sp.]WDS36212.1 MAG: hypothetical protein O8I58_18405 [Pseudoxanthomonas sp.]
MTQNEYNQTLQQMQREAEQAAKGLPPRSNVVELSKFRGDKFIRKYCTPMPTGPEAA